MVIHNKCQTKISLQDTIRKLEKDYQIQTTKKNSKTSFQKGFNSIYENSPLLEEDTHNMFSRVIGSISFISNTEKLDIAYSVNHLFRYSVNTKKFNINAAYKIIHDLIQSKNKGLHYTNRKSATIPTKDYRLLNTNKKALI